mgnify:CR=1 FL=1
MKHHITRLFERDLDSYLGELDALGAEVLRILDLPKGPLNGKDCSRCTDERLCEDHSSEYSRIQFMNPGVKLGYRRGDLTVWLERYAVVYKTDV